VARHGGWREWLAVSGDFERALAGQANTAVIAPHVGSEARRGRDFVRVTVAMTVVTPDVAEAVSTAWWAFRKAAADDPGGWDPAIVAADVQPEGG